MAAKKALTPYQAAAKKRAAAAKKAPAKRAASSPKPPKPKTPGSAMGKAMGKRNPSTVEHETKYYGLYKEEKKAGEDARKRAKQYGTVTGPTKVSSYPGRHSGIKDVDAATYVKSARGNLYRVNESKEQVAFGRDKNRSTFINAAYPDGSAKWDDGYGATGKRDPKFGPAPKKKKKK